MIYIPHVDPKAVFAGALLNHLFSAFVFTTFGKVWLAAMKIDRGGDNWMIKDSKKNDMGRLLVMDFGINLVKAWITGLLLNLTHAGTMSEACQLGAFLYVGTCLPIICSELMWEKRSLNLQQFKIATGFFGTVVLASLMHAIGTN